MLNLKSEILDQALADISDVPSVTVEDSGIPTITFTGNYESPVNDLVTFLFRLNSLLGHELDAPSSRADYAMEQVREGLYWDDNHYGGQATVTLNAVKLDGTSKYDADAELED